MTRDDAALNIEVLATLNRQMAINMGEKYLGSDLEKSTLKALSNARTLYARMIERNRSDYIGPAI